MEPTELTLDDYLGILKRRKWSLIVPMIVVFLAAAAVALLLPPIYKSTATILIEEQEIPAEFVMTTVTSYAEQRLQSINQRIMSFTRLLEIINRFDLYQEERDKWTTEEIVAQMREDTQMEPISAEVIDRRSGRPACGHDRLHPLLRRQGDPSKSPAGGQRADLFFSGREPPGESAADPGNSPVFGRRTEEGQGIPR